MRAIAVLITLLAAPALTGCSFSFSTSSSLDAEEVADQVVQVVTPQLGQEPDGASCPDNLPGKVDATTTCVLSVGGDEFDVDVIVTSADGERATFDIECPDCEPALDADEVVTQIADGLEAQVGRRPEITCPSGLAAEVGAELTCALTQGDEVLDVAVVATAVDGSDVRFSYRVGAGPR